MSDEDDEREVREESARDAKAAIGKPWTVERRDQTDGAIRYEVWSDDGHHRVCSISDDDNPAAKRDAEHIAKLHNDSLRGFIDIVFDGPPGPTAGRFVEVENEKGHSVSIGEWINRESGGLWALRIPMQQNFSSQLAAEMLVVLREVSQELETEAEQRETSGNDEYSKGIRALADRVRKIVGQS